jgi:GNAT superfamily N-acetyltransferase
MMDKYPQLTVFPEVAGKRAWRTEVHEPPSRELSREDLELGPTCGLQDGIYIVTVSANTPTERFDAAHLLNVAAEAVAPHELSTHCNGFVPTGNYDSAIAIVDGRVVGGVIADRWRTVNVRKPLSPKSNSKGVQSELRPAVWDLWVHPAQRGRGLGRQLLEAIAAHFGRAVPELGFRLPISEKAVALLNSMGIEEVLGCE